MDDRVKVDLSDLEDEYSEMLDKIELAEKQWKTKLNAGDEKGAEKLEKKYSDLRFQGWLLEQQLGCYDF